MSILNGTRKGGGLLAASILCAVQGCATVSADFHTAAVEASALLTAAKNDPTLLPRAKAALVQAVALASPADADKLNTALGHVNQGQVVLAADLVAPVAVK